MKAQTKVCDAPRVPELGMAVDQFRVTKSKVVDNEEEMATCFLKLKELVPSIPHNKKLTKVQLLQHVIDYIMDLELTLDCHSSSVSPLLVSPINSERRPLAETSMNTSLIQQVRRHFTTIYGSQFKIHISGVGWRRFWVNRTSNGWVMVFFASVVGGWERDSGHSRMTPNSLAGAWPSLPCLRSHWGLSALLSPHTRSHQSPPHYIRSTPSSNAGFHGDIAVFWPSRRQKACLVGRRWRWRSC